MSQVINSALELIGNTWAVAFCFAKQGGLGLYAI